MNALYKFHSNGKYLKKLLVNNEFHFQHPQQFNDPWHSNLPLQFFSSGAEVVNSFSSIFSSEETFKKNVNGIEKLVDSNTITYSNFKSILSEVVEYPKTLSLLNTAFKDHFIEFFNGILVTCFSRRADSLLLWAHYAAQHKGVCLGFRKDILTTHFGVEAFHDVNYPTSRKLPIPNLVNQPEKMVSSY